jgi:phosphate transport system protein
LLQIDFSGRKSLGEIPIKHQKGMQSFFQMELIKLRKHVGKMFALSGIQLEQSLVSLLDKDAVTVMEASLRNENRIDKLDIKIDKLCQRIFALTQPVASDLRFIMASLRIGNEIERIADIALDMVSRMEILHGNEEVLARFQIHALISHIIQLNNQAAEAYAANHNLQARMVITESRYTEDTCKQLFRDILFHIQDIQDLMVVSADLILLVRDVERICNHLENIGDSIVFIVEARRLRHEEMINPPE